MAGTIMLLALDSHQQNIWSTLIRLGFIHWRLVTRTDKELNHRKKEGMEERKAAVYVLPSPVAGE